MKNRHNNLVKMLSALPKFERFDTFDFMQVMETLRYSTFKTSDGTPLHADKGFQYLCKYIYDFVESDQRIDTRIHLKELAEKDVEIEKLHKIIDDISEEQFKAARKKLDMVDTIDSLDHKQSESRLDRLTSSDTEIAGDEFKTILKEMAGTFQSMNDYLGLEPWEPKEKSAERPLPYFTSDEKIAQDIVSDYLAPYNTMYDPSDTTLSETIWKALAESRQRGYEEAERCYKTVLPHGASISDIKPEDIPSSKVIKVIGTTHVISEPHDKNTIIMNEPDGGTAT